MKALAVTAAAIDEVRSPKNMRLVSDWQEKGVGQASRAISTARLSVLPRLHLPPIYVVVSYGPLEGPKTLGAFILDGASHLDAFSGYPFPT